MKSKLWYFLAIGMTCFDVFAAEVQSLINCDNEGCENRIVTVYTKGEVDKIRTDIQAQLKTCESRAADLESRVLTALRGIEGRDPFAEVEPALSSHQADVQALQDTVAKLLARITELENAATD
jgi:hypothetical protein